MANLTHILTAEEFWTSQRDSSMGSPYQPRTQHESACVAATILFTSCCFVVAIFLVNSNVVKASQPSPSKLILCGKFHNHFVKEPRVKCHSHLLMVIRLVQSPDSPFINQSLHPCRLNTSVLRDASWQGLNFPHHNVNAAETNKDLSFSSGC